VGTLFRQFLRLASHFRRAIEQAGTVAEQGVNDTQIKLFNFYNNLAAVGKVYPFASNTNVLYDEISAYGTDLNNEAVYNNFQKPLADYIEQNKPIEFDTASFV